VTVLALLLSFMTAIAPVYWWAAFVSPAIRVAGSALTTYDRARRLSLA
jgi:hypothetical protein